MKKHELIFIFIIVFLSFSFVANYITNRQLESRVNELFTQDEDNFQNNINISKHIFEAYVQIIFNEHLNSREIKTIMQKAYKGSTLEQTQYRKELYNRISGLYSNLVTSGIRQLHFHFPDNTSFLRMHKPDKFGDNLTKVRSTVKYVNETKQPISGFEEGRIFNGYRYVFPLISNLGLHLGSVECSISVDAIIKNLESTISDAHIGFIIDKKVVEQKVFKDQKSNYIESYFPGYFYDKHVQKNHNHDSYLNAIRENKDELSLLFFSKNTKNKVFSGDLAYSGKHYIVTFYPLINPIDKDVKAYIFKIQKNKLLASILQIKFKIMVLVESFIAIILFSFFNLTRKNNELNIFQADLLKNEIILNEAQKISNLGHWELDIIKNKLSWSDEVYRIFGREPQEFAATYDAFLSYIHPEDRDKVNKAYSDSIVNKTDYNIVHRVIDSKGNIKHVEERCQHDFVAGEVVASLGTVLDITDKVEKENQLKELVKSIEFQSNQIRLLLDMQKSIVISSDGIKIMHANREFFTFFGLNQESSVLDTTKCVLSNIETNNDFCITNKDVNSFGDLLLLLIQLAHEQKTIYLQNTDGVKRAFVISINGDIGEEGFYIVNLNDVTKIHYEKMLIEESSMIDHLTNAYNRKFVDVNYYKIIKEYEDKSLSLGIIIFDIDNFKLVNDTYGHDIGDIVLKDIVIIVMSDIRDYDYIIRWGGEEFLLITGVKNKTDLLKLSNKIRESIEQYVFDSVGKVTCSFGLTFTNNDFEDFNDILKQADIALYKAKNRGKNCCILYEE